MAKPCRSKLDNYTLLLAVTLGLVLAATHVLDTSRYGLQRMLLNASPVLAIWLALLLHILDREFSSLLTYVVPVTLVALLLVFSGLVPHLLGMDRHTGIFLSPGDSLYKERFIESEYADALSILDPDIQRVFFYTPYEHEACVSQSLIHPYKFTWVEYKYEWIIERGVRHYYIISSDRLTGQHYQDIALYEKPLVDIPGLRIWEADLRGG